eukprot:662548-Prymnesium_polylepis.1
MQLGHEVVRGHVPGRRVARRSTAVDVLVPLKIWAPLEIADCRVRVTPDPSGDLVAVGGPRIKRVEVVGLQEGRLDAPDGRGRHATLRNGAEHPVRACLCSEREVFDAQHRCWHRTRMVAPAEAVGDLSTPLPRVGCVAHANKDGRRVRGHVWDVDDAKAVAALLDRALREAVVLGLGHIGKDLRQERVPIVIKRASSAHDTIELGVDVRAVDERAKVRAPGGASRQPQLAAVQTARLRRRLYSHCADGNPETRGVSVEKQRKF